MSKVFLCLGGCFLVLALIPASAQANLFWFDSFLSSSNIVSSELNGDARLVVVQNVSEPRGLAADGEHIYWTSQTGTIGRSLPDGTGRQDSFITGLIEPSSLAVTDTHIYWSEPFRGYIGRASLDGSGVNRDFLETLRSTYALSAQGDYLYWITGDLVGRARLDGSELNREFIDLSGTELRDFNSIATSGSYIYLGAEDRVAGDVVYRVNLDGTGLNTSFLTSPELVAGLAASEEFLYVALRPGSIGRAPAQGTSFDTSFITGLADGPRFLALYTSPGRISSSPSELSFPAQRVGTISAIRQVEFENSGSGSVAIEGVRLDKGEDFLTTGDTCPASLASGQSCRVTVRFAPGSAGQKGDTLSLLTGAGAVDTPLAGLGTVPAVRPTVTAVGKAGRSTLRVRVSCGGGTSCRILLSGGLGRSAKPAFRGKRISVSAGKRRVVRINYGAALKTRVARLLRNRRTAKISVRARNLSSGKSSRILISIRR
ncbi:MAG: choice-of-anchor D domain-containing protein [Solirubrobacterales bacterium]